LARAGPSHRGEALGGHDGVFEARAVDAEALEGRDLVEDIEFDVDIERRKARIVIPGVLESTARPIRSPATGAEHRVRIDLPNGIEFDLAEIGSGTTQTMASIALDLKDTYCHFTVLRQSGKGVVRSR